MVESKQDETAEQYQPVNEYPPNQIPKISNFYTCAASNPSQEQALLNQIKAKNELMKCYQSKIATENPQQTQRLEYENQIATLASEIENMKHKDVSGTWFWIKPWITGIILYWVIMLFFGHTPAILVYSFWIMQPPIKRLIREIALIKLVK
jgi:hypothetical protein